MMCIAAYVIYIISFYHLLPAHVLFMHAVPNHPHYPDGPVVSRLRLLNDAIGFLGLAGTDAAEW